MDPQQRLLLETTYEALEAAGYSLEAMNGSKTSVHVGVMNTDFSNIQLRDSEVLPTYNATGTSISILSNRLSYFFNLKGPSVTVDTACSSSLVALHQAVQGLRAGDATSAIVAGANLIFDPAMYIAESSLHMLSPDSCSRMWDKAANGYARGEGFGVLLLKPLSRAIMDGDHIEAVIRSTGVNSDGRTKGITMPNAASQTELIRQTYRDAGLDPVRDRCQYFECHGTGTAAGDPIEARAVHDAFFPTETGTASNLLIPDGKLYVGSVKTIIGHLEGCAGIAGVLKAVLAIKNRTIPPNMHFHEPNPEVIPFCDRLQIPTAPIPWPDTGRSPMRASVNSFGFGGTNAHAIIEGYDALSSPVQEKTVTPEDLFIGPLLFSASSSTSLVANVKNMAERIRSDASIDLESLVWTLHARRSVLPIKAFFTGGTVQRLLNFMDRFVAESEETTSSTAGIKYQPLNPAEAPGVLGIFTGQGAQWASMGSALLQQNLVFRAAIERCQAALAALHDGPAWSLVDELIGLVDMVRSAGIKLDAVVGHSSGEIAAVYAAGIIDAEDAIKIAYYRGYYAKLASGTRGQAGRMLATAMSFDEAEEFCARPQWHCRLVAAASNSPQSVTLSGDIDAIEEAMQIFESEKKFARILRTDTAYHSHHMQPCAEPYLRSLRACQIKVNPPRKDCVLISSVRGDTQLLEAGLSTLADQYWVDNMCNPVLFSQAVETSIWNGGPFDVAVELGPHPALKGPVEQTIKAVYGPIPAYAGLMRRGDNEIEAFSGGGRGYRKGFKGADRLRPQVLKDLPPYSWDHSKQYWRESRISRQYRLRQDTPHELLGRRVPDDTDDSRRWRNVLRLSELPWIKGHVFQGQVLFPGAGYVAMALEAARALTDGRPATLFEIEDVSLRRALVIPEQGSVETVFTARVIDAEDGRKATDRLEAEFACYFCSTEGTEPLAKACTGRLIINYGDPAPDALPQRTRLPANNVPVDMGRFYDAMNNICRLDDYVVNPGFLDVAFQSLYTAFSSPASGEIWAPYLPIHIERLAVNPNVTYRIGKDETQMEADAFVTAADSTLLKGDIQLYQCESQHATLQVEGISMKSMSEPQPENDRCLFSETVWGPDVSLGVTEVASCAAKDDNHLVEALDRVSLFYWQKLLEEVGAETAQFQWYHQRMFDAVNFQVASVRSGQHPIAKSAWLEDDWNTILAVSEPYASRVDMRLIHAVGENLASVVRGDTQLLEVMVQDDMLNRFYMEGYGFSAINNAVSDALEQITFKYPHANTLEIGAGTGGTTRSILDRIGSRYGSYTYTDISPAFFKAAAEKFEDARGKIQFRVLDVEKEVGAQGFNECSYDVIVAANVLHATHKLEETMNHVRALLKPGGYLVLMEITGPHVLRTQFIMGGLPGWWYGVDDGRVLSPAISVEQWSRLLLDTGFSGLDCLRPDMLDEDKHSFSLMVSQAIDEKIQMLRYPALSTSLVPAGDILIIGGRTNPTVQVVQDIRHYLASWTSRVQVWNSIQTKQLDQLAQFENIICLEELDQPLFSTAMTGETLVALQRVLSGTRNVVWAINSANGENAHVNMTVGIGRALRTEVPGLNLLFVDVDAIDNAPACAQQLSQMLLQLVIGSLCSAENMLWAMEPEIRVRDGRRLVPRVLPITPMNETYNASRRVITKAVDIETTCVTLEDSGGLLRLVQGASMVDSPVQRGHDRLRVHFSLLLAVSGGSPCYLCSGVLRESGHPALALSTSNANFVDVPNHMVLTVDHDQPCDAAVLEATARHLLARNICSRLPASNITLVYQPSHDFAQALLSTGRHFSFAATDKASCFRDWIYFHPRASRRAIQSHLPENLDALIDCTGELDASLLGPAYSAALTYASSSRNRPSIQIRDLPLATPSKLQTVDWTGVEPVELMLQPLSTSNLFSPNATYLLAGMTGDLGLSLCRWMINNGARIIALTSRNPNVDEELLQDMRRGAVDIRVFRTDITDRDAVCRLVEEIRKSMPRIAGVFNACMVLQDGLFSEMDADTLNNTLAPKVDGSKILDEIFQNDSLDFFVLFSSLASIIGNAGQSNYHAANMFLSGLAANRRKKGLAASVLHIGLVTDVGYVARKGQAMEERLRRLFFLPLSESDIHHAMAQTILTSPPHSTRQHEIILGLEPFVDSLNATKRPPWEHNPKFSHYVSRPLVDGSPAATTSEAAADVKQLLRSAVSAETVTPIVQEAFARKLESMMQLPANSVNLNVPLIDLGCDSLLAIEIRRWFIKEVGIDVPVLKVLSGDTTAQICEDAVSQFLALQLEKKDAVPSNATEKPKTEPQGPSDALEKVDSANGDSETSSQGDDSRGNFSSSSSHTSPSLQATTPGVKPSTPAPLDDDAGPLDGAFKRVMIRAERASFAQSRLWFLTQYLHDPTTYNVTVRYDVRGKLPASRIVNALDTTIRHHQSLQTCFFMDSDKGTLMQGALSPPSSSIKTILPGNEQTVIEEYERLRRRVWDLEKAETFAVSVVSLSPEQHTIIFGYHHIVMDGVSWHLFLRDLDLAYRLRLLPSIEREYIDWTEKQFQSAQRGDFTRQLDYWRKQYSPPLSVMPLLPMARTTSRKPLTTYDSHVVSAEIDRELVSHIRKVSQSLRVTSFHFHLAVIQSILCRLLKIEDLCIGVADANRTSEAHSGTVGFFLNLLPVRFNAKEHSTFQDLVSSTKRTILEALSNSETPFDLILDDLKVVRSAEHSPLFQVAVNYRMGAMLQVPLGDGTMEMASADDAKNPYDLSFGITETATGACLLELTSQKQLYTEHVTELLLQMYVDVLRAASDNPSLPVNQLPVTLESRSGKTLAVAKGPRVEYSWPSTLWERFDAIQKSFPEETAIKDGNSDMSYSQLARRVEQLAATLISQGVAAGDTVGVLLHPSIDAIACMLASLRVGCIYTPLDTRLPRARLSTIVDGCKASLVLYHAATHDVALELGKFARLANVDDIRGTVQAHVAAIAPPSNPTSFLFYTSGSTGAPKGILLTQQNFVNHLAAKTDKLALGREVVLQQSSLGFDMSVVQTFCALGNGGTLVIAPEEARGDPVALSTLMAKERVTLTITTPSEYSLLLRFGLEQLQKPYVWRHACMGGEVVSRQLVQQFCQLDHPDLQLTNCYGPTEITAAATFQDIPLQLEGQSTTDGSLVGKPLPNYSVYIMDASGSPVPIGIAGEICIGGAGVSLGYLNFPEQTDVKFVQDPFASPEDIASGWTKMYRTGDMGRLLEDGTLVFMGRMDGDNQVKLNGVRIELDGIANSILASGHDLVSEAVVTVRAGLGSGSPFLVAHVVPLGDHVDDSRLQQLARDLPLPPYMLPSVVIALDRLPTHANGKVDRKAVMALPLPTHCAESAAGTGIGNARHLSLAEGELCLLWEKGAIKQSIGVSIPIAELYQFPTLGQMARRISRRKEEHQASHTSVIDWDSETSLTQDLISAAQSQYSTHQAKSHDRQEILLTGSTTFLGKTILQSLLHNPLVERVHCVAVTPEDASLLPSSDKIIIYTGNLLTPNLGLSQTEMAVLQSSLDVIIHAGSTGHCLNNYSSLRTANLGSTRFLAGLALSHRIPIHFISSNRVTLLTGNTILPPVSVSSSLPNPDGSEGFTASKWACERFLESAAALEAGLPVTIHRPCAVIGDEAPNEDALNALLKHSKLTRCVPRFENFEGYLDFDDVHRVAGAIAADALSTAESKESKPATRFVHHSSGHKVSMKDFRGRMETLFACPFEEVSMAEWIERALQAGIDPLITGYLEAMTMKGETIRFPFMGEAGSP
ncbi:putative hybrid NRPS/PKS enzyme [Aspergillus fischeri NRRL 181]|uniref:Hybrid NRPS/PKS enzyme, putative n=1 Tax=Neosartorya fischeri (strain ATCC 1020 / DSM 3700 / CBS 544.65 / FGSC A1164 / JCM 1740 / NRRL 181 / WB 181) TaxID=331117 RepID=A1DJB5_NEOFI|nr:hybrid NRPS/PKS enzyme, putative [Aspergillus fischeri NRRL 181]EAW16804.1 hybrid NRPS/PKS enzyme, putative [Aspergillus fischeri NRRL 181]